MWRRTYLVLLLVRLYFTLCPSYLHPDEAFQGPEIVAGQLFPYPSHRTWEWTVAQPIRSVFPLWLFYGLPMTLFKWLWVNNVHKDAPPEVIYYVLRVVMFMISFVLEDWAIHDMLQSPRYRRQALVLVASSYVTWTFQTHTFSNSVETILVLWSLVLMDRITHEQKRSAIGASIVLGFVLVLGTFNRTTFPAFIVIPGLRLLPHLLNRPFSFLALWISGLLFTYIAVATDTAFYSGPAATESFRSLFSHMRLAPVLTPLNNIRYNSQVSNLAEHGLHPNYQHLIVNLPQLLGPALAPLISAGWPYSWDSLKVSLDNPRLTSAATGTAILSLIPHQEPRFLLPCVPLLLTCVRIPSSPFWRRTFWISWSLFNAFMSILMGLYHQGGVIPAQIAIPNIIAQHSTKSDSAQVFWWKAYPPPTYLLGPPPENPQTGNSININTTTLMGLPQLSLMSTLTTVMEQHSPPCEPSFLDFFLIGKEYMDIYLAAPFSAWRLHHLQPLPPTHNFTFTLDTEASSPSLQFTHIYTADQHINLDDLDFGEDGILPTLSRIVGRRGLGIWRVEKICPIKNPQPETGERDTSLSEKTPLLIESLARYVLGEEKGQGYEPSVSVQASLQTLDELEKSSKEAPTMVQHTISTTLTEPIRQPTAGSDVDISLPPTDLPLDEHLNPQSAITASTAFTWPKAGGDHDSICTPSGNVFSITEGVSQCRTSPTKPGGHEEL